MRHDKSVGRDPQYLLLCGPYGSQPCEGGELIKLQTIFIHLDV